MRISLTLSPVPESLEERRVREVLGILPYVTSVGLGALLDSSAAAADAQMRTLTQGLDALYTAHLVSTGAEDCGAERVYTLSERGVALTFAHPQVVHLLTDRLGAFSRDPECSMTVPARQHTATALTNYLAADILVRPGLTMNYAACGNDSTSFPLALPTAATRADAFMRVGRTGDVPQDLYLFAIPSWSDIIPVAESLQSAYGAIRAERATDTSLLLVWTCDPMDETSIWNRLASGVNDGLRQILRTTHSGHVPTEVSDKVVPVSPRRIAATIAGPVWSVEFSGNRRLLSATEIAQLPRCRLELFDGGPKHPEGL